MRTVIITGCLATLWLAFAVPTARAHETDAQFDRALEDYRERFVRDFVAVQPPLEKASD